MPEGTARSLHIKTTPFPIPRRFFSPYFSFNLQKSIFENEKNRVFPEWKVREKFQVWVKKYFLECANSTDTTLAHLGVVKLSGVYTIIAHKIILKNLAHFASKEVVFP